MPLHPGQKLTQPAIKKRLQKFSLRERLTVKERKAADHYLDNGVKMDAIKHAYTLGSRGGSKTKKQKFYIANSMTKDVFNRQRVQDYLHEQSSSAASRVVDLSITADSDAVRLNANKDILDRAGFKPKEVNEIEVKQAYDEEQIQRAIKEINEANEKANDKRAIGDDGAEGKE